MREMRREGRSIRGFMLFFVMGLMLCFYSVTAKAEVTYSWPVDISIGQSTHQYGYAGHTGCDFATGTVGKPVYAVADGVATVVDRGCKGSHQSGANSSIKCPNGSGCGAVTQSGKSHGSYGNYIYITHSNGVTSYYCHLSTGRMQVSSGETVKQGQLIGYSGTAGNSSGPHLHFELRGASYNRCPCELLTRVNVNSAKVKILGDHPVLYPGDAYGFAFEVEGDASRSDVQWFSDDHRIATVDGNGAVKGVEAGKTTITAMIRGKDGTIVSQDARVVTVKERGLELTNKSVSVYQEKFFDLLVRKEGIEGGLSFSSSDKKVASVSSSGKITGKKPGTAQITVRCGKYSSTCKVTVKSPINVSPAEATLYVKGKLTLKASLKGIKGTVKWSSSNNKVATVSSKGKILAKKKGTCVITAKVKNFSAKCKITVKDPTIQLNPKSVTLQKGKAKTLKATVKGPSKKVAWKSSNTKVATVNSKGKVTAKKAGTVVITAKANGKTARCTIKVKYSLEEMRKVLNTYMKKKRMKCTSFASEAKVKGGKYQYLIRYQGGSSANTLYGMILVDPFSGKGVFESLWGGKKTWKLL